MGSQYAAIRCKELVTRHKALPSMSHRGNCYDSACTQLFWSRFKADLIDGSNFPVLAFSVLAEAKLKISHHIAYYNAERQHSALGYLAPNNFEPQLRTTS